MSGTAQTSWFVSEPEKQLSQTLGWVNENTFLISKKLIRFTITDYKEHYMGIVDINVRIMYFLFQCKWVLLYVCVFCVKCVRMLVCVKPAKL